jgi:hypothetical protein
MIFDAGYAMMGVIRSVKFRAGTLINCTRWGLGPKSRANVCFVINLPKATDKSSVFASIGVVPFAVTAFNTH